MFLIQAFAAAKGGSGQGVWRTINGSPVFIQGGSITKGPANLVGLSTKDAKSTTTSGKSDGKSASKNTKTTTKGGSTSKKTETKKTETNKTETKKASTKTEPTAKQKAGQAAETKKLANTIKKDASSLGNGHKLSDSDATALAHLNLNAGKLRKAFKESFSATNQKAQDKADAKIDAIFSKVAKDSGVSKSKVDSLFDLYNDSLIYGGVF